jgi:hypothetical protein
MYIKVFNASADGKVEEAMSILSVIKGTTDPAVYKQLSAACQTLQAVAKDFDCDKFLKSAQTASNGLPFQVLPISSHGLGGPNTAIQLTRMPYLPCVSEGLAEAFTGVRSLAMPFLSEPVGAFQRIKSAHARYPEALAPFLGGILLERTKYPNPADEERVNFMAGELFEMAADSSSIYPTIPRLARYMAAQTEFDLAKGSTPKAEKAATACIKNIQKACANGGCSVQELSGYFGMACALKDYDLGRTLLIQWERLEPNNYSIVQKHIELELASGPFEKAQADLAIILSQHPEDPWALGQKAAIQQNIRKMAATLH